MALSTAVTHRAADLKVESVSVGMPKKVFGTGSSPTAPATIPTMTRDVVIWQRLSLAPFESDHL